LFSLWRPFATRDLISKRQRTSHYFPFYAQKATRERVLALAGGALRLTGDGKQDRLPDFPSLARLRRG
jgi:hypothetical protein